jgi:rhodanese-related sulfurtransferase
MSGLWSRWFGSPKGGSSETPEWIDSDECQRRMAAGVSLIDVRGPDEFNAPPGHLPGAVNVPLAELNPGALVAKAQPVVLVCKSDKRSARAAETLMAAGLRDVAVLRGGTDAWHQRGLPLE